jgi:hypothetical protein
MDAFFNYSNCSGGFSGMEKILFIVSVFSFAGLIGVSIAFGVTYNNSDDTTVLPLSDLEENVCTTPECTVAGWHIENSISINHDIIFYFLFVLCVIY